MQELKQIVEKEAKGKKVIFGIKETIKALKKNSVSKIFLVKDCIKREEISEFAKQHKAEIIEMEKTREEAREILKKPYSSNIISILK